MKCRTVEPEDLEQGDPVHPFYGPQTVARKTPQGFGKAVPIRPTEYPPIVAFKPDIPGFDREREAGTGTSPRPENPLCICCFYGCLSCLSRKGVAHCFWVIVQSAHASNPENHTTSHQGTKKSKDKSLLLLCPGALVVHFPFVAVNPEVLGNEFLEYQSGPRLRTLCHENARAACSGFS